MEDIVGTVVKSIAGIKEIAPETVRLDSTLQDLKMDSLDGIDLCFELEEAFDLTIPDESVRSIRTVGEMVEQIEKLVSEKESGLPIRS